MKGCRGRYYITACADSGKRVDHFRDGGEFFPGLAGGLPALDLQLVQPFPVLEADGADAFSFQQGGDRLVSKAQVGGEGLTGPCLNKKSAC